MSLLCRGSVTMNNESFLPLRRQLARPTAASRWLQPPPVILIHRSSHPLGDFMSELVIITGDCLLTFLLRPIRSGAEGDFPQRVGMLEVWRSTRLHNCSSFLRVHVEGGNRSTPARRRELWEHFWKRGSLLGCCWSLSCWRSFGKSAAGSCDILDHVCVYSTLLHICYLSWRQRTLGFKCFQSIQRGRGGVSTLLCSDTFTLTFLVSLY